MDEDSRLVDGTSQETYFSIFFTLLNNLTLFVKSLLSDHQESFQL